MQHAILGAAQMEGAEAGPRRPLILLLSSIAARSEAIDRLFGRIGGSGSRGGATSPAYSWGVL